MRAQLARLAPLAALLPFAIALWLLHDALSGYHYDEVQDALASIPTGRLVLALVATGFGYGALTAYDALACRYIERALPYWRAALASFLGFALSQTAGIALLSGGAVRYRLYTSWGFTAGEVARIVAFCTLTFWLGLATLGAIVLVVAPPPLPGALHLPFASARPIGLLLAIPVVAYVVATLVRRTPLVVREWEIALPAPRLVGPQLVAGALDWAFAAAALWILLPDGVVVSLPHFLGCFLLAQTVGVASNVPGGLGVFETSLLLLLGAQHPRAELLAALIAYRAIYYFVPLALATVLLVAREVRVHRAAVRRLAGLVDAWAPALVPRALALGAFAAGLLLLLSGATPAAPERLDWLSEMLPLPVLEGSHFLGSLVGVGLLLLARDLQRRLDAAYLATVALLAGGIVLSLLKGADWEEASVLALLLALFLPCHRHFYRRAALTSAPLSPAWTAAVALTLGATVWLVFFAYRHVEYSRELWWQFELAGDAPRALRATTGAVLAALFAGVWTLRRHAPPEPARPTAAELARAHQIVAATPGTDGNLALLGDKSLLWSDSGRAFVMYGVAGRSWVALGDPIGPADEHDELVWRFRELSDRHGGWTVFYQVADQGLPRYLDLGLTLLKLGEEARVSLATFSMEGRSRKALRHGVKHLADQGWAFSVLPAEAVPPLLPELRAVSDAWLREKHTREKGFSLGFFQPDYLACGPVAVVRREGTLVAFANLWLGADRHELSLDLMRHRPDAPNGIMDFLFVNLMQWGKAQGFAWFDLGMAPLSGLAPHELGPLWNRVGALVFRYGEHFYNFQGLRQYKEKFDPEWRPKYLAAPGGFTLPRVLANVASLISGGLGGVIGR